MELSLAKFRVATGSSEANAALYYEPALESCARFRIETPHQLAGWCATIGIESARLTKMEEDLYYRDAERLAKLFRRVFDEDHDGIIEPHEIDRARPYCRMPKELSQKLYGGYHGRGGIQITWEKNYAIHSKRLGVDYLRNPEWVLRPLDAMLTAGSYWDWAGCNAVAENMDEVTRLVNGPARLHLAERIALRNLGLEVLL